MSAGAERICGSIAELVVQLRSGSGESIRGFSGRIIPAISEKAFSGPSIHSS